METDIGGSAGAGIADRVHAEMVSEGLTPEEAVEQAKLREEYIEGYRRSVRHHIEGIKVVDEEGNDVTPEKLRQIQREKGLHGRSLDDPES